MRGDVVGVRMAFMAWVIVSVVVVSYWYTMVTLVVLAG